MVTSDITNYLWGGNIDSLGRFNLYSLGCVTMGDFETHFWPQSQFMTLKTSLDNRNLFISGSINSTANVWCIHIKYVLTPMWVIDII